MLQNEVFSLGFLVNSFTMVEENFQFQNFEMLQMKEKTIIHEQRTKHKIWYQIPASSN